MRGVRSVTLRAVYDQVLADIAITPSRGGFTAISDEQISVMYESPAQLGRAVHEAMKKATA
ncbi:hypothetical protein [uncultured Microbacterium sp.]|uniref:hypothetical protein n=1 Tax=uncultured Microbacterium sp. TaxID=191216 RepID=UPI0028D59C64|nr:hypothetical protein [uncultured Microbacterium sp.]